MFSRRSITCWCLTALLSGAPLSAQQYVPIDPSLFSVQSAPGIASWAGNSLSLDLSVGGPLYGGFTQTPLLAISALPPGIIGISFSLATTLPKTRLSFGLLTYDAIGNTIQDVILFNYGPSNASDLTSFTKRTMDFSPNADVDELLGPTFSPFSLAPSGRAVLPFQQVASRFSLDFRADGYDARTDTYSPGTVSFNEINWITADAPTVVTPEPESLLLLGGGLAVCLVMTWRRQALRSNAKD